MLHMVEQSRTGLGQECWLAYRLSIATPGITATAQAASVYKEARFSDHAPLIIDYDWPIAPEAH